AERRKTTDLTFTPSSTPIGSQHASHQPRVGLADSKGKEVGARTRSLPHLGAGGASSHLASSLPETDVRCAKREDSRTRREATKAAALGATTAGINVTDFRMETPMVQHVMSERKRETSKQTSACPEDGGVRVDGGCGAGRGRERAGPAVPSLSFPVAQEPQQRDVADGIVSGREGASEANFLFRAAAVQARTRRAEEKEEKKRAEGKEAQAKLQRSAVMQAATDTCYQWSGSGLHAEQSALRAAMAAASMNKNVESEKDGSAASLAQSSTAPCSCSEVQNAEEFSNLYAEQLAFRAALAGSKLCVKKKGERGDHSSASTTTPPEAQQALHATGDEGVNARSTEQWSGLHTEQLAFRRAMAASLFATNRTKEGNHDNDDGKESSVCSGVARQLSTPEGAAQQEERPAARQVVEKKSNRPGSGSARKGQRARTSEDRPKDATSRPVTPEGVRHVSSGGTLASTDASVGHSRTVPGGTSWDTTPSSDEAVLASGMHVLSPPLDTCAESASALEVTFSSLPESGAVIQESRSAAKRVVSSVAYDEAAMALSVSPATAECPREEVGEASYYLQSSGSGTDEDADSQAREKP
ncbi:unnamed protein product, partial [Amoebophrya sp. A25]